MSQRGKPGGVNLRVVLAKDNRGNFILARTAKRLGIEGDLWDNMLAGLKTIAGATLEENRAAKRFSDFHRVGTTTLKEIPYRGVGTEYRLLCLQENWKGNPALVVGRVVAREAVNKDRKKAEIAKSALREIQNYLERS